MMQKTVAYVLDGVSRQPDPNMADFYFDPRSLVAAHESHVGQMIFGFLTSRAGSLLILGAVLAAPSRPPVVAAEPFLSTLIGEEAFTDEIKKYTGRLIRQIVEHFGGRFVRRGVKVTVPSRYGSGSIYSFDGKLSLGHSADAIAELEARFRSLAHRFGH